MEGISREHIKSALVFVAMAAISFGIFYGAYHGPWDKDFQQRVRETKWTWEEAKPPPITSDEVTLTLQEPVIVGRNKLVFQGLEQGQIHIDVYILELDPQSAYHHTISIDNAKKGLQLGGDTFSLISYGKTDLKLRIKK